MANTFYHFLKNYSSSSFFSTPVIQAQESLRTEAETHKVSWSSSIETISDMFKIISDMFKVISDMFKFIDKIFYKKNQE